MEKKKQTSFPILKGGGTKRQKVGRGGGEGDSISPCNKTPEDVGGRKWAFLSKQIERTEGELEKEKRKGPRRKNCYTISTDRGDPDRLNSCYAKKRQKKGAIG